MILHVDSGKEWRGGQRQALLLHQGLLRHGVGSVLAYRSGGGFTGMDVPSSVGIELRGEVSLASLTSLRKIIKETKPDIVHSHDAHSLTPLLFLKMMGYPFKLVHTRRVDFSVRKNFTSIHKYKNKYINLVAVSQGIKNVLIKDGLDAEAVTVIHDGVPPQTKPVAEHVFAAKASLGLDKASIVLGSISNLADHKDHITMLRAFKLFLAQYPNAKLLVVGDGPEHARISAERQALQLEDSVILAGFRADVGVMLACMDIFLVTSYLEGLNTSLIDAMSAGLPVVATDTGGIPELVLDNDTGYLAPPRNPQAISECLIRLAGDSDKMKAFGDAGHERAELFTDEIMTERYLEYYRESHQ